MILERSFDHLMEKIRCDQFMDIGTRECGSEGLEQQERVMRTRTEWIQ